MSRVPTWPAPPDSSGARLAVPADEAVGGSGQVIELAIGGMTCASCAARVEKKLNRLGGVTASVNYATEKARVVVPAGVSPAELIRTVEATGYTATLPAPRHDHSPRATGGAGRAGSAGSAGS
ncbi:MAG: cation transporter, partial [Actinomycetes bacterium]